MNILIEPGHPLRGEISLPGDKSLSHRAALFASLASGESQIENYLTAGVTYSLLAALRKLGVSWRLAPATAQGSDSQPQAGVGEQHSTLIVQGAGFDGLISPIEPINCGNSGTTMRFLAGALAGAGLPAILDGSNGLRRRPMERIADPLRRMGAPIHTSGDGHAPLILSGRTSRSRLQAIDYRLPVASAQVKTALILAALRADGPSHFIEPYQSRDHSERMLHSQGAVITSNFGEAGDQSEVTVYPQASDMAPLVGRIPGDLSSAAFLIVAALIIPESEITILGVGLNPTRMGLVEALLEMGADIRVFKRGSQSDEPYGDLQVRSSVLQGYSIAGRQVVRMIDEIPVFAVAGACANGPSEVSHAQELRLKESDRISALCGELNGLGVEVAEKPDGFLIMGGRPILGGEAKTHGDHRLAMALTVAGLAARSPTRIMGAGITSESYPGFFDALRKLGAYIEIQ